MKRDDIEALLPFLANGTLEDTERDEVEAAVAADASLAQDLRALRAIRDSMKTEETFSPGPMGQARLMRAVSAEVATPAPSSTILHRPAVWQVAAAVMFAVVIGQTVIFTGQDTGAGYELAGEAALTISINETATEAQIRALLLQAGVEIVAGPSTLGLYELQLLEGVTETMARDSLEASDVIETISVIEE